MRKGGTWGLLPAGLLRGGVAAGVGAGVRPHPQHRQAGLRIPLCAHSGNLPINALAVDFVPVKD